MPQHNSLPICRTCGAQYSAPRADCPICLDERQYVGWGGQQWTSLEELRSGGYRGHLAEEGPDVMGVGCEPSFAIGQRALLLRSANGNVLWDCTPYLDDDLVQSVKRLGGISAIAISHPHFYGAMVEWGKAFGAPVLVHAADREWVARPDSTISFWDGAKHDIAPGMTLVNAGVHFRGGTVLHWEGDGNRPAAVFSGDIFQVVMDRRWVSFMYSYPNLIPERRSVVQRAVRLLEPYDFERIYGAWWGRVVQADGAAALRRSARRYLDYTSVDDAGHAATN